MNNYSLMLKSIILVYTIYSYIQRPVLNMPLFVISILILTALSFLASSFRDRRIKIVLIGLSIIIICVFFNMFPILLFFIPVLIVELCFAIGISPLITALLLFTGLPFAFLAGIEETYFLICGSTGILIIFLLKEAKAEALQSQIDGLRIRNQKLIKRIEFNETLKSQITYTAQLEERNRIAQELHDKIGHSISGSLMQLEAIKLLTTTDPPKAAVMLQKVVDTLRGGLDSIRITLRNLKPPSEQMGINRLQLMVNEFKNKNHIETILVHEGDLSRIKPAVWKILIENTMEALTNILRHSHGDRVSISILVLNKIIRYQIKDNGHVIHPIRKGLGLSGMEERLFLVNGSLIVDNSEGFTLTMLVPNEV